jgi:FtsP/CotA-like multicopper oxidase with cupredoxin domain
VNRYRVPIVVAILVVFVVVGGILIFANQSAGGKNVTIDVTVTGGAKMIPDTLKAHHNDTVTINVTSDIDGEVHIHGYDIHFDTKAGQVVSQTFRAANTGDFPIEWESTSTPLGHLVVS